MIRFFALPCAAALLLAASASAAQLQLAQAVATDPAQPAPRPKKVEAAKPKAAAAAGQARKKDEDYLRTVQEPRRIRREDLEDDPRGPVEPRFKPGLTPEGRPALGGRF